MVGTVSSARSQWRDIVVSGVVASLPQPRPCNLPEEGCHEAYRLFVVRVDTGPGRVRPVRYAATRGDLGAGRCSATDHRARCQAHYGASRRGHHGPGRCADNRGRGPADHRCRGACRGAPAAQVPAQEILYRQAPTILNSHPSQGTKADASRPVLEPLAATALTASPSHCSRRS
jgi:hypothetical protein